MKAFLPAFMVCLIAAATDGRATPPGGDFDPGTLDYAIRFDEALSHWSEFAFFGMPGQLKELEIQLDSVQSVEVVASAGKLVRTAPLRWTWRAPDEPGLQTLTVRPEASAPATLNVFVQVPADRISDGFLNGYRIGTYPRLPLRNNPVYMPPAGLVEVHPDMLDLRVSPHFTLGQFLCKQQPNHWPKYLVLRESLIAKLETILAEVNRRGIRTDSFVIMSGYRTPWYNRSIGNVAYSRHVWGGAADIYIDNSGDGQMDDLNHDGRIGTRDARVLLNIINDLYETGRFKRFLGGLGLYGPRPHRGPFVHVDARGEVVRWEKP